MIRQLFQQRFKEYNKGSDGTDDSRKWPVKTSSRHDDPDSRDEHAPQHSGIDGQGSQNNGQVFEPLPIIYVRLEVKPRQVIPGGYFFVTLEARLDDNARDSVTFYAGNTVFKGSVAKQQGGLRVCTWWGTSFAERPPIAHEYPARSPKNSYQFITLDPGGAPYTEVYRMRCHTLERGVRYRVLVAEDRPITWWRYGKRSKVLSADAFDSRSTRERWRGKRRQQPMQDLPKEQQIVLRNVEDSSDRMSCFLCPRVDGTGPSPDQGPSATISSPARGAPRLAI